MTRRSPIGTTHAWEVGANARAFGTKRASMTVDTGAAAVIDEADHACLTQNGRSQLLADVQSTYPIDSLCAALRGACPRLRLIHRGVSIMPEKQAKSESAEPITREKLIDLLNQDLSREYQAIIAYVVYSQVLKGAAYMNISKELEVHATEELQHALTIAKQIDYLGGMPTTVPQPVKVSEKAEDMLRFDLDNENTTIINYRARIKQCESLGEYALAEQLREIVVQEQEHQIDLATALGIDVPDVSKMKA